MKKFASLVVALLVVVFTTACSGGGGSPTSPDPVPTGPVTITVNIDSTAIGPLLVGGIGNFPITASLTKPLVSGEIRVATQITGGTVDYYLFTNASYRSGAVARCTLSAGDCSAALAGPVRGVSGQELVLGRVSNVDTVPIELIYIVKGANPLGSISVSIKGEK